MRNLLECVVGDDVLQSFQLERVSRGHDVVVVDELDEWLDFRSLVSSLLAHAAGDFGWVTFDACDESIGESVGLGAVIDRLDDDHLKSMLVLMSQSIASRGPAIASCVENQRIVGSVPSFRHIGLE